MGAPAAGKARFVTQAKGAVSLIGYGSLGLTGVVCGLTFLGGWPRLLVVVAGGLLLIVPAVFTIGAVLVGLSRVVGTKPVLIATVAVLLFGLGLLLGTDAVTIGGAAYAQDVVLTVFAVTPRPSASRPVPNAALLLIAVGSALSSTWILFAN